LGDRPGKTVNAAAGRVGHDELDQPAWKLAWQLAWKLLAAGHASRQCAGEHQCQRHHRSQYFHVGPRFADDPKNIEPPQACSAVIVYGTSFTLGQWRTGAKRGRLRVVPGFETDDESGAVPELNVVAIHQLPGLLDRVSIAVAGDDNGRAHDVVVLDLVDPIV